MAPENSTVMVSPSEYTASPSSGSSAVTDKMEGPSKVPKSPTSAGDVAVEGSEVSSIFLRLLLSLTANVNTPIAGGVAPIELVMNITRVDALLHVPV